MFINILEVRVEKAHYILGRIGWEHWEKSNKIIGYSRKWVNSFDIWTKTLSHLQMKENQIVNSFQQQNFMSSGVNQKWKSEPRFFLYSDKLFQV